MLDTCDEVPHPLQSSFWNPEYTRSKRDVNLFSPRVIRHSQEDIRGNRQTVESFRDVRFQARKGTLENGFRQSREGFRPVADQTQIVLSG
jgi:hypothetical protein